MWVLDPFEVVFSLVVYLHKCPAVLSGVWISSFPNSTCWKDYPFPIKWAYTACQKSFTTYLRVLFWVLFFHWLRYVFMLGPHCFDNCVV